MSDISPYEHQNPSAMRKKHYRSLLLLIALVIALFTLGNPIMRAYEALLFVGEQGGYSVPAMLQLRSEVTVKTLHISKESRHYIADLYLPEDSLDAGIVLLHGAAQAGKDDARLVEFAHQLAGKRFAVLVPDLPGPKDLKVRARDAQVAVDIFQFFNQYPGLEERVGIGGISVSAGLAFLAALRPEIHDEVAFIFSIGGYHNLPRTLKYSITGEFLIDGQLHRQKPNSYGKWVFVLSNLDFLNRQTDRRALRRIAYRRMKNPEADISDLEPTLSTEGKAVLDYITEPDARNIDRRYAALPAPIRQHIEALNLVNKDLKHLQAHVLLIHGYDDTIVPFAESVSLARALPPHQVELFLIQGLEHVDSMLQTLNQIWQYWRASYALLTLRDRLKG